MSKSNESPKDRTYALCDKLGYETVREKIDTGNMTCFTAGDDIYVHSWFKKETDSKKIEKRAERLALIAFISTGVAIFSAVITLYPLIDKFLNK